MTEPIQHVEDLIHSELEFLAQLLSHTPHEEISPFWLQDQSTLLETFPLSLLKPHFVLDRIEASLPFAPEKACLCPSHKPLNAVLIRRLYNELREECTTHLKRFDEVTFLPSRIAAVVKRLKTVRSLWMNADEYRATARPKPEDARYDEVENKCEACILACVGGNHKLLSDLRASMRGRKKRRRPHATLLPLVEAWIEWTGKYEEIRKESGRLGREINIFRRKLQKQRWAARGRKAAFEARNGSGSRTLVNEPLDSSDEKGGNDSRAAAFYAEKLANAPSFSASHIENIHPAIRKSIIWDSTTGTFQRISHRANFPKPERPYSESMYSDETEVNDEELPGRSSVEIAQTYQDLLEHYDDEENPRGRTRYRD